LHDFKKERHRVCGAAFLILALAAEQLGQPAQAKVGTGVAMVGRMIPSIVRLIKNISSVSDTAEFGDSSANFQEILSNKGLDCSGDNERNEKR
jgi:hypothetical protein